MLLIIDNYDSFVFNVARYCAELGHDTKVVRNDALSLDEIERLQPQAIIISPGPSSPIEAGLSLDIVRHFSGFLPILGVCLGHQCIGVAYGGRIAQAAPPMHGRSSSIQHDQKGLFQGLQEPLTVGRYHSLVVVETPEFEQEMRVT
ncbi:MAG: anthranilate synthase component II, partial [Geminicoccaceae bacterium]